MQRRTMIMLGTFVGLILAAGGCAQQYYGVTGFDEQQTRATQSNQQQNQQLWHRAAGSSPFKLNLEERESTEDMAKTVVHSPLGSGRSLFQNQERIDDGDSRLRLYGILSRASNGSEDPLDGIANVHQITFTEEGSDFDPEVDPTGQFCVYASTRHREKADIYVKRVGGPTVTQVTNAPGRDEMPAFSPGGQRIAFTSDRQGNWDIFIKDIGGGQPVQLTNDLADEIHPSFSPDGRQLVYCMFGQRSGQWEIVLVDIENPGKKHFLGFGIFPQWSPTGKKIVFQRARKRGTRWFSIWTIDLVNGESLRPTEIVSCSNAAAITPAWSPDGQFIVFSTVVNPDSDDSGSKPLQADIWMVRADGTGRANLTNSPFASLQPAWGSDGTILFVSNRAQEGRDNIWSIRPDSVLRVTHDWNASARETFFSRKRSQLDDEAFVAGTSGSMTGVLATQTGTPQSGLVSMPSNP